MPTLARMVIKEEDSIEAVDMKVVVDTFKALVAVVVKQGSHPNNQVRRTGNVELVQSGFMKGVVVTSIGNMLLNSRKYWEQF